MVLRLQLISRIIYHYTKISEEVQISKRKEKDYMYIYSTFKLCDETVAQWFCNNQSKMQCPYQDFLRWGPQDL